MTSKVNNHDVRLYAVWGETDEDAEGVANTRFLGLFSTREGADALRNLIEQADRAHVVGGLTVSEMVMDRVLWAEGFVVGGEAIT